LQAKNLTYKGYKSGKITFNFSEMFCCLNPLIYMESDTYNLKFDYDIHEVGLSIILDKG